MRPIRITAAVLTVTVLLTAASAREISQPVGSYSVYAGGSLSVDRNVEIGGAIGSAGDTWLDRDVSVDGDAYSGRDFTISRNVHVSGTAVLARDAWGDRDSSVGGMHAGRNAGLARGSAVNGHLAAGGNVGMDRDAAVSGDMSYGRSYWMGHGAKVDGQIGKNSREIDTWVAPEMSGAFGGSGGSDLYYAGSSSEDLSAGSYGRLNASSGSTLRLTAGTYSFSRAYLGSGVQVQADTSGGNVVIEIADSLSTDREVSFTNVGGGDLLVKTHGGAYLARDNRLEGSLVDFGNGVSIDRNGHITGGVASSGNVWMGRDGYVGGNLGGQVVPEPATAALVGIGGILTLLRRRRNRK
ncbi:MAG: PEP-CTERM sorting domain-containing protein [Phycisphaerae bacterium]